MFNAAPGIDADPRLTRGCENSALMWQGTLQGACWVLTPMYLPFPGQVSSYMVANDVRDAMDAVPDTNLVLAPLSDTAARGDSTMNRVTWAVWRAARSTPPGGTVPEPGSALLAALGLAVLAAGGRRTPRH